VFVGFQGKGTPGRKIVDGAEKIRILGEEIAVQAKVFTIGGFSAHAGQSQILEWLEHFRTPEMKVFLVHGENSAQKTLASLIEERFGLSVHVPGYLETCTMKPGLPLEVEVDEERAHPSINWDYLFSDAESKLRDMRDRLDTIQEKSWVDQTDLRDRLLAINKELMEFISEV
jgi:metallo-beta-lactamase family protein